MRNGRFPRIALLLVIGLWPSVVLSDVTLTLKRTFIEKYKNRATIEAEFIVDHSKGKPNSASKDGDMHVAGRSHERETQARFRVAPMCASPENDGTIEP